MDPNYYSERGYPHEHWREMRRTNPIGWCETEELVPFWAITKYRSSFRMRR